MDGSGAEAVRDLIDRVRANLGRIDVLVNNPAETPGRALAESSHADLQAALESSLIASFAYLRAVIPSMRERRYGRVINICSLDYLGAATRIDLAAAHAGIFGLTRSVALDTAADGITVNCVVKGDVAGTDMPAADAEKLASRIPAKRLGKIDDLVHAIGFFASASTKYVTGQTLFVCGGKSAFFSMSV
jgi:3-oxoacyl-[acyl-carrier protein] reductase/2-[hydroxy(phenyl)methyl]-succinyl-CoA dehydrogenase BbsC subunit